MASLEKRVAHLEAAAGVTEPEHLHIVLIDFAARGPEIPAQRIQRPGMPDLLITFEREAYGNPSAVPLFEAGDVPEG